MKTPTGSEPAGAEQNTQHAPIFDQRQAQQITHCDKRYATAQARCALAGGFVLRKIEGDGYLLTGPGVCREFQSIEKVELWVSIAEAR